MSQPTSQSTTNSINQAHTRTRTQPPVRTNQHRTTQTLKGQNEANLPINIVHNIVRGSNINNCMFSLAVVRVINVTGSNVSASPVTGRTSNNTC